MTLSRFRVSVAQDVEDSEITHLEIHSYVDASVMNNISTRTSMIIILLINKDGWGWNFISEGEGQTYFF